MDSKQLALSDQLLSLRGKFVSRFGLWICASIIALSLLLLSNSLKGRTPTPLFQGFNSVAFNSSLVSWPFSFKTPYFPSVGNDDTVTGAKEAARSSSHSVPETPQGSVLGVVLDDTHLGNFTEYSADGSFAVEERTVQQKISEAESGNYSDSSGGGALQGNHSVNYSSIVKKGSAPNKKGLVIGNISFSSNRDMNTKGSIEGKLADNCTYANNAVTYNNRGGSLPYNAEVNRFSDVEEKRADENQNTISYETCDIFDGRWVKDDSKPYYPAGSCPYIGRDFDCHLNGRSDDGYVKWKWQPNGCDIPSLNATDFLKRLRGKKLVFVGDSLNRNMWESLVCILRHSITDKKRVYEISGRTEFKKKGFYAFRFEDYNCTVDFVGSPFLVRESSFNGGNGTLETLRLDLMDKTTSMYQDADVIVFNTGHWWTHEKTSRGEDYYQEGNHVHRRLKVLEAYKRALKTWGRWLDKNIDSNRTQIFFRGYSVTHFRGGPWNSGGQCHKETEPIFNAAYLAKYPSKMRALEHVLPEIRTPVTYLNISRLTDYRKDGHPSIYRMNYKTAEKQVAGEHTQDCSHWCLPGVPDTWNELLYASLLKAGRGPWGTR